MWAGACRLALLGRQPSEGLFSAMVFGFGTAVGGLIGGPLLESMGGRGLYLVLGVLVLAIAAIVALVQRRLSARQETLPHLEIH